MRRFPDRSIRGNLMRIALLAGGTALLTASALFVAYDIVAFRAAMVNRLTTAAQMVGMNSVSALVFKDEQAAATTLAALSAEPHVTWAGVYDRNGRLFATYRREDLSEALAPPLLPPAASPGWDFRRDHVVVAEAVSFEGAPIGRVVIQSDLGELKERVVRYLAIVVLVSIASLLLALVASTRFQRRISEPVLALANTARAVSRDKDYGVRAPVRPGGEDEIALLVGTFNEMLEQIQRRDVEVSQARDGLERRVEERTRDLRASRALVADAQRVARMGSWELDLSQRTLAWSDELFRLYGLEPREGPLPYDEVFALTLAEDRPGVQAAIDQSIAGGGPFSFDYRVTRSDGAIRLLHAEGSVVGEAAEPRRLVGLVQDITERRLAEEQRGRSLREESERAEREAVEARAAFLARVTTALASTLDYEKSLATPVTLSVPGFADWCVLDVVEPDGRFRRAAAAHGDPARAEAAQALRDRPLDRNAPTPGVVAIRTGETLTLDPGQARTAARDPEHARLLEAFGAGHIVAVPIVVQGQRRGSLTWSRASREWEAADVVLAEEIARRTGVAVEHAQLYQEAQTANRLKDEFLATLSHELRTPLHAIVGWAHMLRSGRLDADGTLRAVETIDRNAQIQNQLISDILEVSRIMAGKLRLNVRPVSLPELIDAAVDTVRPAADAKEVRLERILDPSAGPISGDPDRLQQVFWNLLSNAIKFAPRGGRVQVRLERVNSHVEVVVEDDGPGIRPEFLPHVFERFRQADSSSTRPHGGLGLGLAIVRHLVELHGGSVNAANRDGGTGAIFTVRLARRSVVAGAAALASPPQHPAEERPAWLESAPALAGVRVLVVDDEPDSRDMVATVLEMAGAEVVVAGTAFEGLALLGREKPDVLLSDLEMPGEDGYSLIRRIRSLPVERGGMIPAAALTAYASSEHRMKTLRAGFQIHVAKPVQPAELITVVSSLAGRAVRRAEPRPRRVLVVEDDADLAEGLEELIRTAGFETRISHEGKSALEAVANFRPGLVLIDLGLPGIDGLEVARQIRADPSGRGIVLIALTGYGDPEDLSRSKEAGFDRHVVKPVHPVTLRNIIDSFFV